MTDTLRAAAERLKPCPFCGARAEFERTGTPRQSCIVVCTDCGARHESSDEDERSGWSWNQRAGLAAPPPPAAAPAYGVIDPDYARIFTQARVIAWQCGYALAMHGSFTRDLDLLAVPWTEAAIEPERLVDRIVDATGTKPNGHPPGDKPHGRRAWTLLLPAFGDPRFVDLSVMPRATPAAAPTDAMVNAAWKAMKVEPAVPMTTAMRERLRASIKAGIEAALREQGR